MTRKKKNPLRSLSSEERTYLEKVSRSQMEPASRVAYAKALLAVADGDNYTSAARACGRRSGDAVSQLVQRFNQKGLTAIERQHGGGTATVYGAVERERIVKEFRRAPERERDGTATWSISTLQRALRLADDGLPTVSRATIWQVLREANLSWQRTRSWCQTGCVLRKRKTGIITVIDPNREAKKT
jgi:transposase